MNTKKVTLKIPLIPEDKIPGKMLYTVIVGSHLHGNSTKNSDVDIIGVYLASKQSVYLNKIQNVVVINSNVKIYELSFFIKLLAKGSPTIIETIFAPKSFQLHCDKLFEQKILSNKMVYLNKAYGESVMRIVKKNLENVICSDETIKVMKQKEDSPTIDIRNFLKFRELRLRGKVKFSQVMTWSYFKDVAVGSVNGNIKNLLPISVKGVENYYDLHYDLSGSRFNHGGLFNKDETAINNFEFPTSSNYYDSPIGIMYFEKDAYDLAVSNNSVMSKWKGKTKDVSKNWVQDKNNSDMWYKGNEISHCFRIIDTALDCYKTGVMNVHRPSSAEFYNSIKQGKEDFNNMYFNLTGRLKRLRELLDESSRPEKINTDFTKQLVSDIREIIYNGSSKTISKKYMQFTD